MARKLTLDFLEPEAASGTVLGLAAVAAVAVVNSPWSADYSTWLKSTHALQIGPIRLEETISDWIKEGSTRMQVYGVSLLCGVGFTMSLFIGVLAFPGAVDSPEQIEVKLGVIGGSILSAIGAAIVLGLASRRREVDPVAADPNVEPIGVEQS